MSAAAFFEIATRFIHRNKQRMEAAWECLACGSKLTEQDAQAIDWDCPNCGASMKPVREKITNVRALKGA